MGSIINVKQPGFNLRSRLNELDYDTIPYEKMPLGSVLQVQHNYVTAQTVFGATTSATEVFGIDISPKSRTSSFLVSVHVSYSHDRLGYDNADHGDIFLFLRRDASYIGVNSNLTRSFGYTNNNAWYKTDVPFSNDAVAHTWQYDTMAQDIEVLDENVAGDENIKLRYSLFMMCQNNFELNRGQQNSTNGASSFITVQEIKT
tara:strand:- start:427 stop:1032 length:606 start_codon:yes stop_codon:yes gene_type:complete